MLHELYYPPLDKVNGISPSNPNRPTYMEAAEQFLENQIGEEVVETPVP
jgi:hypothetical protein